jgi:hypothetical protein
MKILVEKFFSFLRWRNYWSDWNQFVTRMRLQNENSESGSRCLNKINAERYIKSTLIAEVSRYNLKFLSTLLRGWRTSAEEINIRTCGVRRCWLCFKLAYILLLVGCLFLFSFLLFSSLYAAEKKEIRVQLLTVFSYPYIFVRMFH